MKTHRVHNIPLHRIRKQCITVLWNLGFQCFDQIRGRQLLGKAQTIHRKSFTAGRTTYTQNHPSILTAFCNGFSVASSSTPNSDLAETAGAAATAGFLANPNEIFAGSGAGAAEHSTKNPTI
jgi:hypothetical protein